MNSNDNPNINSTSSKPIKKMVLWTRINNSKSTSPHLKDNSNAQKVKLKTIKSNKKEKEHISVCQKEKKICSPFLKSKDISNYSNNRNYLNYARITTNKLVNSQPGSFQSNTNDEEKNKLKILLNVEEKNNEKNENVENNNSDENIKDDIELGNLIVSLIERDVNDLYSKQIIDNVKIDQINAITYSFENKKLTKNVTLKIQNDNLFCDNGVSFNSWLINNFGI